MLQRIDGDADIHARRKICAVDGDSTRKDFTRQYPANARAHAQCFINASTKVLAVVELSAAADLFCVSESGADFAIQLFETGGVVEEVEYRTCDCCRSCVCA